MSDPVTVCAAGESAWNRAAYAGLGATWTVGDGIAYGRAPHRFLFSAVTLTPRPALPGLAGGELRDSWSALTSADLPGWHAEPADPWMLRAPGPCSAPPVDGVTVVRTEDALRFEHAAFVGFTGTGPGIPGELHPAGSAGQPGLALFLALQAGEPVGTALAVAHESGVLVGSVTVRADRRRLGIGALLTAAAIDVALERPATLSSSALGAGVYRRLGFEQVGQALDWRPPD